MVSAQVGKMGYIGNLSSSDFRLEDGQNFQIKNDGLQAVTLEVQLAGMDEGEFVETRFETGWSPEIVRVVKATTQSSLNLKWGY